MFHRNAGLLGDSQSVDIKWASMLFSLFSLLPDCTSKGCCPRITMDATNVWWPIKLGTQFPLSSLPVVAPSLPLASGHQGKISLQIPVIFVHHKKKPNQKQTPIKTPEQVNESFSFQSVPEGAWEVATLQFNQKILF